MKADTGLSGLSGIITTGNVVLPLNPPLSFTVSPASVLENSGTTIVFTLARGDSTGQPLASGLVVNFTNTGTATLTTDYTMTGQTTYDGSSGTATFGAGVSVVNLTVTPVGDTTVESDETIILRTVSFGNDTTATGTIVNDDFPVITVTANTTAISEAGGVSLLTFTATPAVPTDRTVNFTYAGTATFSTDYTVGGSASYGSGVGTIVILSGNTTAVLTLTSVTDMVADDNETIIITATSGTGYSLGTPITQTITIQEYIFILDGVAASMAAYALRRLRSAYTGNCIRIRRSSDNTEQNIGFASNVLNTAAITTFVGGGDGFLVTWYEQSGIGFNITQSTAASQPRIVNGGILDTKNGLVSLVFNGVANLVTSASINHSALLSASAVASSNSSFGAIFQIGAANTFGSLFTESSWKARATGSGASTPYIDSSLEVLSSAYQSTLQRIWRGGIVGTDDTAALSSAISQILQVGILEIYYTLSGNISELVLFDSVLSTSDRQSLERNQGIFYGITVA